MKEVFVTEEGFKIKKYKGIAPFLKKCLEMLNQMGMTLTTWREVF